MGAHIPADPPGVVLAHPLQRPPQKILPVGAALDVGAPLLDVRVLAVAELFLGLRDERAGVDRVQQLLLIERHTGDVDRLEPLLDLRLGPFALVDQEFRVRNPLLLVGRQAVEHLRVGSVHDGELVRDEPPDTGDALLAVEHLELVRSNRVEVDQPERIPLEQRVNDRLLALPAALGVDVVPLVLWLNGELPAQAEQAFAFELIVDEAVADVGDGEVGAEGGYHFFLPLVGRRWRIIRRA